MFISGPSLMQVLRPFLEDRLNFSYTSIMSYRRELPMNQSVHRVPLGGSWVRQGLLLHFQMRWVSRVYLIPKVTGETPNSKVQTFVCAYMGFL